jgi:23S rRNA (uracil1939-C5)-methyltransferase
MSQAARLRIESIAAGGDGVGRHDGLAVFVPRTAPGDVVEAALESRGRFARGRVTSVIESAADRVDPPCVHYTRDRCGGCQLQHLRYDAQLVAKGRIIADAIQRIGHRDAPTVAVRESPRAWAYRTKLTLALRWRGGRWVAGLHPYDDPDRVFQLEECLITDDRVVAIWRDIFGGSGLLPRVPRLRASVRVTADGAAFVLEGGSRWPHAHAFAERVPALTTVWWEPQGGRRRLVIDRRQRQSPDASFAQVNPGAASLLHDHVVATVMAHAPRTVVDAYAGAGATAVRLAERGATVVAIELDQAAARWMNDHLPPPSRAIAARVEDALAASLPADVVIANPPRAGVDERVTDLLREAAAVRAVVYVSCNPATLARDLARLPNYRIASLTAFDMFPQTAHVETVCELIPEAA